MKFVIAVLLICLLSNAFAAKGAVQTRLAPARAMQDQCPTDGGAGGDGEDGAGEEPEMVDQEVKVGDRIFLDLPQDKPEGENAGT